MAQYKLFKSEAEILKDAPKWNDADKKRFLNELKKMPPEKQKEFWKRCHDHWTEYR